MTEKIIKAVDADNKNICYHELEITKSQIETEKKLIFLTAHHLNCVDEEDTDIVFQYVKIDDKCNEFVEYEKDFTERVREELTHFSML